MSKVTGPSLVLDPEEIILLEGGTSGLALFWAGLNLIFGSSIVFCMPLLSILRAIVEPREPGEIWSTLAFNIPFMLICILLFYGPWLFSGHYWLTTRRVIWKPRLGRVSQLFLDEVEGTQIKGTSLIAFLHLPGKHPLTLRFIRNVELLWGGILLLQDPSLRVVVERAGEMPSRSESVYWLSAWSRGDAVQNGFAVLTPEALFFVPLSSVDHLSIRIVEGLFSALVHHAYVRSLVPKLPLEPLFARLAVLPADEFVRQVEMLARRFDGKRVTPARTEVQERSLPGGTMTLKFTWSGQTIQGTLPAERALWVHSVLASWPVQLK